MDFPAPPANFARQSLVANFQYPCFVSNARSQMRGEVIPSSIRRLDAVAARFAAG
jgi:hypothetical protein